MDFKERLIRNDMRHLADTVKSVSEELIVLQEFILQEFASQFHNFLNNRKSSMNAKEVAIDGPSIPKIRKLNLKESALNVGRRNSLRPSHLQRMTRKQKTPKVTDASTENDNDLEVFSLYPDNPETEDGNSDNDENHDGHGEAHSSFEESSKHDGEPRVDSENESNPPGEDCTALKSEKDSRKEDDENIGDSDFYPSSAKSLPTRKRKIAGKGTKFIKQTGHGRKKSSSRKVYGDLSLFPPNCPICDDPVPNAFNTRKAHLSTHSEEEVLQNLVCQVCCHKFSDKDVFTRHMEKSHSDGRIYKCSFCNKQLSGSHRLVEHERTHTGEKPFQCGLCENSYSRAYACRYHISRTHKVSPDSKPNLIRIVK